MQEPDSRSKPAAISSLGWSGPRVVSRAAEEPVRRGMQLGVKQQAGRLDASLSVIPASLPAVDAERSVPRPVIAEVQF